MKNNNPNNLEQDMGTCGPSKKAIKKELKSLYEAKEMIWDLAKNGYIPYEVRIQVQGGILLDIGYKEEQLKGIK